MMLSDLQLEQKRVRDAIESTGALPKLKSGVCRAFKCYQLVASMSSEGDPWCISQSGVWTEERLTLMAMIAVIPLEDYIEDDLV